MLLYSDLGSRNRTAGAQGGGGRTLRVAIVQQASVPALDDTRKGLVAALEARGYVDGGRISVRRYNAEGDMATANAIAKEVTTADVDLIISISTPRCRPSPTRTAFIRRGAVFGAPDPYSAGIGINRENHADHPPYMTGLGSMPPVEEAFRLAKELRPGLKRVGLVWNPTESNSVAATKVGRAICATLGITLVEANAESSTAVREAAASLLARDVDALWLSPDVTTSVAAEAVLGAAKRARLPVFSSLPGNSANGALFDLGADYVAIGGTKVSLPRCARRS